MSRFLLIGLLSLAALAPAPVTDIGGPWPDPCRPPCAAGR